MGKHHKIFDGGSSWPVSPLNLKIEWLIREHWVIHCSAPLIWALTSTQ